MRAAKRRGEFAADAATQEEAMAGTGKGRDVAPPKYDVIYSQDLVTPHVKWADPYAEGPVRAFIISSVHEGRAVVELRQRLTMEARVVSIDPRWDVNKWCMDRYADFDNLTPRDYTPSYRVLESELAADAKYDVIVMHSMLGWNHMPEKIKRLIEGRVKRGEGLVLVHPHLGEDEKDKGLWELSPIVAVPPTRLTGEGAGLDEGYPEAPKQAMSGKPWRKAAEHYIVDGIPFEALPYGALRHYVYRLGKGATALATGERGSPVVAVKEYGKGRVVGLGYHNYALFPELAARRGELNETFWEYLFSLLMRSVIWAGRKEPSVRLASVVVSRARGAVKVCLSNESAAKAGEVMATFRDELGELDGAARAKLMVARGKTKVELPLPGRRMTGGRHTVDVMVATTGRKRQDWGSASFEVRREARVTRVALAADAVAVGKAITGKARLAGKSAGMTLRAELWDINGRLLSREEKAVGRGREVSFRLTCPDALASRGWVRCTLLDGGRYVHEARAEVALTARRRKWQDYEVIMPWAHGGVWPWTGLIEEQYAKAGITSMADTQYRFPLTLSMHPPGFGIYWYRRQPYLDRKDNYRKTGDKKWLVRVPCIHTEEFRRPVARALRRGIPPILKYSPLAYYIADESSITCYEDAMDLCWGAATLTEFRKWLRRWYGSLEKLNAEWGRRYRSWEKVMPVTYDEAQRRGNPAPWVDHRLFMNKALADAFRYAGKVAQKVDPQGLVTISGTQVPGSHNGCDWSKIDRIVEYLQPYSGGGQDEMHRSFNPDMILTGFTGYAISGVPLEYEIWHRFLHGHRGASIFWGYTLVDPDLTLNAQGRSLGKCFGQLRGEGVMRALMGMRREHDKIAIHFSMASGHTWWIQDGKLKLEGMEYGQRTSPSFRRFIASRVGWGQALEDLGYQYSYLPYSDLEAGGLAGYRALVLPGSIALSEKEVEQIKAFVKRGGLVLADEMPGQASVHGKRLPAASLAEVFAGERYGKGRGVLLGRWLDGYDGQRMGAFGRKLRGWMKEALEEARIRPRAMASAGSEHPVGVERVSWSGGGIEALALLKEPAGRFGESSDGTSRYEAIEGMRASERVKVALPKAGHWYDLRAHRYLGEVGGLSATLTEADPKVYAMLPYRVEGVSLKVSGGGKPGEAVSYEVAVKAGRARPVRHVLKVEVFGPDSEKRPLYSGNVEAKAGRGRGEFRLALNDERGEWRMVVTEVFSGEVAEKKWRVR